MTLEKDPPLLTDIGRALWGERWQTEMSRALDVTDRTIRGWAAGERPTPTGVFVDLLRIVIERQSALDDLIAKIRQAGAP